LKKILLLLCASLLFANSIQLENKIFCTILQALFPNKSVIKVYTNYPNIKKLSTQSEKIRLVSKKDADIIILDYGEKLQTDKPVFVRKYSLLKRYKSSAIGGFYWQKGRPNIIFLRPNLQKHNLSLPETFNDYIEEEL